MTIETQELPMFFIAGIAIRTINKEGHADKDIGGLWQRFTSENLAEKLAEKEGSELYCVYTEYAGDHTDYYTAILGCKVASIAYLPDGFTGKAIPAGKYKVYTPEGDFPASVAATWQHIWNTAQARLYTADFDVYDVGGKDFNQIGAKVYVAVY